MSYPAFPEFKIDSECGITLMTFHSLGGIQLKTCVLFEEGANEPSAKQLETLKHFDSLSSDELSEKIAIAARGYFRDIDDAINLAGEGITIDENGIESHYRYLAVTIPQHGHCGLEFVFLDMNCDWEEEHGMHVNLVNGQVVYCGSEAALHYGSRWKQIISVDSEVTCRELLSEYLAATL